VLYTHAGRTFGGGRVELFEIDQHDLRFDGVSRVPVAGSFALHGRAGDCELLLEPIGAESIRGIGAGYDAGQGKGRADSAPTAHSTIDLADATAVEQAGRGTIDTPVRCTFTGPSGETRGLGVWETALGRSHYRYGSQVAAR
jgi:hypothetical protein